MEAYNLLFDENDLTLQLSRFDNLDSFRCSSLADPPVEHALSFVLWHKQQSGWDRLPSFSKITCENVSKSCPNLDKFIHPENDNRHIRKYDLKRARLQMSIFILGMASLVTLPC